MTKMTRAERAYWQGFIDARRELMALRDWRIELLDTPPTTEGALAEVIAVQRRKRLTVSLCLDWRDLPPADQAHNINHELIHGHFAPMRNALIHSLDRHLTPAMSEQVFEEFDEQFEYGVDGLADGLDNARWPLPDVPKGVKR